MEPIIEEINGIFYASVICCGLNVTAQADTEAAARAQLELNIAYVEKHNG